MSRQPPYFSEPVPHDLDKHLPKYLVCKQEWEDNGHLNKFKSHRVNPRVVLLDFGDSFFKTTPLANRPFIGTPSEYHPPEYYFPTGKLGDDTDNSTTDMLSRRCHGDYQAALGDVCEKIDVWSCGATMLELIGAGTPRTMGKNPGESYL